MSPNFDEKRILLHPIINNDEYDDDCNRKQ